MIGSRLSVSTDLTLDPAIRNWVVLPLLLLVLCINLMRSYLQVGGTGRVVENGRVSPSKTRPVSVE
jgi:hypothetical protein